MEADSRRPKTFGLGRDCVRASIVAQLSRCPTTLHRNRPMLTLRATPITAERFAPYGWLADADAATGRPINDGSSQRIDDVGELQLTADGGAPCLALFRAEPRDPRGPWKVLERHRLGTQTFVPMGGARYVLLVALGDAQRKTKPGACLAGRVEPEARPFARHKQSAGTVCVRA